MNNTMTKSSRKPAPRTQAPGFSIIELMVAMAIFLVVGGAAVSLIRKHAVLFTSTQNQAGVNLTLRNAVAQMQNDVVNAGSGYYPGTNSPFWPVGVTIQPATTPGCTSTTYTASCFDQLIVLTSDPTMPAASPSGSNPAVPGVVFDSTATTTIYLTYPDSPTPTVLAARAATYASGNEILLLKSGVSDTPQIRPLVLTAAGSVAGGAVQLTVAPFSHTTNDTLGIFDPNASGGGDKTNTQFSGADTFGPGDYAIRLDATRYGVNANNQLMRQVGSGVPDLIADRIVGFSVSAYAGSTGQYEALPGNYNNDWSQVRALKVQILARTLSNDMNEMKFTNGYDGGNYQVQGVSVVINPRNLSMDN